MTFPKKYTRKINVEDRRYLWHLNQNTLYGKETHITIAEEGQNGQILFLDPYPWSLEIRPQTIRNAILWALANGWRPQEKGSPLYLGFQDEQFIVLPPGAKFTSELDD